jgi:predicted dehydrogenase
MAKVERRNFIKTTGRLAAGLAAAVHVGASRAAESGRRIKVGQIGTAHAHAGGKMAAMRKLIDDFEVVGVVEPDADSRKRMESHPIYRDLTWMTEGQLLATPGLRMVAVETAVSELVATAARCVAAGMHLHLDKPAGDSLPAFKKVLEAADRQDLCIQMGYMFRNNPGFQLCFRAVHEGWLGTVFELHGVISKYISDSRRDLLARQPGGTMFELGCHLIDAMVAALGKPESVTPFTRRTRPERDQLRDNMLAVFEYPKATCTIRTAVVEVDGGRRRQFVVCGDQGTVDIRPLEPPKLLLALDPPREGYRRGYQEVELPPMPGRYDDQMAELARIIRGEIQSPYPSSHDLAVHEMVLRASGMSAD